MRLGNIVVCSCVAEGPEETSYVEVEVRLSDGTVAQGEMSPAEARSLARTLENAAISAGGAAGVGGRDLPLSARPAPAWFPSS
jgi:hypothetical protein